MHCLPQIHMQNPTNFPNLSTEILPHLFVHHNLKSHTIVDEDTRKSRSRSRSAEKEVSLSQLRGLTQVNGHCGKSLDRGKPRNEYLDSGNGVFRQKYCRKLSYGLDNDVDFMFIDIPKSSKQDQAKLRESHFEESDQRGSERTLKNNMARDRSSCRESCSDFLMKGLSVSLKSTFESELSEPGRFYYHNLQKEAVYIDDEADTCDWTQENGTRSPDYVAINTSTNVETHRVDKGLIVIDDDESEEEVDEMKIVIESFEDNEEEAAEEKPREIQLSNEISLHDGRPAKMECYFEEKQNTRDPRRNWQETNLQGTGAGSTPEECIVLDDE